MNCKFGCEGVNLSPQLLSKHYMSEHPGLHTPNKDKQKKTKAVVKTAQAFEPAALTPDQIMVTVLNAAIFPNHEVPIEKLPIIFAWRQATEMMLDALA